jgi:hypothetical protein
MKERIFNKMKEYGWTLDNFNDIFNYHCNSIDEWYNFISTNNYDFTMQDISKQKFSDMIDFMSDFFRAMKELGE